MKEYIQDFLSYMVAVKNRSHHTVLSYENDLNNFVDYCTSTYNIDKIKDVNHLIIRSWIMDMKQNQLSNASINRKLSALKSFYKFLRRRSIVTKNPMVKVMTLKNSKRLPVYVPEKKMDYLLEQSLKVEDKDSFIFKRDYLILELLYTTGIRRSELLGLRHADINISRLEIKVLGKGDKERLCPLFKETADRIHDYVELKKEIFGELDHDYLVVTEKGKPAYAKLIYNIVSHQLKSINASEKTSPHVLRHTFATHLSSHGAELNAIKELLGHASLAATQIYTHNSIDRLKKEYKKAHPKGE